MIRNDIAVICPTRSHVAGLKRLWDTLAETSSHAALIAGIDDDQRELYLDDPTLPWSEDRLVPFVSPRAGPSVVADRVAMALVDRYDVFGVVPDDAEFCTTRWDDYTLEHIRRFPGRIGVVSAHHKGTDGSFEAAGELTCYFPFISREWLKIIGRLNPVPDSFHGCSDSALALLGEATRIVRADENEFFMLHDVLRLGISESLKMDAIRFLLWCACGERSSQIKRLRAAAGL